ncbi:hypothetical protein NFJ02_41g108500 [Pycnococcus provasolii]
MPHVWQSRPSELPLRRMTASATSYHHQRLIPHVWQSRPSALPLRRMAASATSTPHRLRQLSRLNHQVLPRPHHQQLPPHHRQMHSRKR